MPSRLALQCLCPLRRVRGFVMSISNLLEMATLVIFTIVIHDTCFVEEGEDVYSIEVSESYYDDLLVPDWVIEVPEVSCITTEFCGDPAGDSDVRCVRAQVCGEPIR